MHKTTSHIAKRMSQRGISRDMVDLVLSYGVDAGDKIVLGRREATELLEESKRRARLLMKVLDKGGVVVVAKGEALITAYNCERRKH